LRFEHPAEAHQHHHRQHGGNAERRGFVDRLTCATQVRPDDGSQEGQHRKGKQAREQRPEIPASVAHGPDHGGDKRHRIEDDAAGAAARDEERGDQHYHAHDQEVPTSPHGDELKAQPTDSQPDECHQTDQQPLQDPGEPT